MLQSIIDFLPLFITVLFITMVLEIISGQYFYGSLFKWGIPIIRRTLPLTNFNIKLPIGETVEMKEGAYKFMDSNTIFCRFLQNEFSFRYKNPILLLKITACIKRDKKIVSVVARMHIALTLLVVFFYSSLLAIATLVYANLIILGTILFLALMVIPISLRSWYKNTIIKVDLLQTELSKLLEGLANDVPQQDYQ